MLNFRWDVIILAFVKKRKNGFPKPSYHFLPLLFNTHVALLAIQVHEMTPERYSNFHVFFFYNCVCRVLV